MHPAFGIVMVVMLVAGAVSIAGVFAWYRLARLKIDRGYPLETTIWGKPVYPRASDAEMASLRAALEQKDAQMARLDARVQTLERILTDRSHGLAHEIDRLRD
jgi:hypothetical protein